MIVQDMWSKPFTSDCETNKEALINRLEQAHLVAED